MGFAQMICSKFQFSNPKSKINSKHQYPMTPSPHPSPQWGEGWGEGVLNLVHWNLFVIWCLEFGASY
jgi:hypothetical protein